MNVGDVQTASGDVGGDQQTQLAAFELIHGGTALGLRLVAMDAVDRRGGDLLQELEERFGGLPRVDEDQNLPVELPTREILAKIPEFLALLRVQFAAFPHAKHLEALLDVGVRLSRAAHRHTHRRSHPIQREPHHARRKRRRKQQQLPIGPHHAQQRPDLLLKAQRNHAVGLVQHHVRAASQRQVLRVHQIDETPGRADDEVEAAVEEGFLLLPLALSAGNAQHRQMKRGEERFRHGRDLLRQFPRRNQHDPDGSLRLPRFSACEEGSETTAAPGRAE